MTHGVKTLVLPHLVPGDAPEGHWESANATFKGKVIIGKDLMRIALDKTK